MDFQTFIAEQEQQKRPWLFVEKAKGKGPGYHAPHVGRPGKIGGSRPRSGGKAGKIRGKARVGEVTFAPSLTPEQTSVLRKTLAWFPKEHLEDLTITAEAPPGYKMGKATFIKPSGVWVDAAYHTRKHILYVHPKKVGRALDRRSFAHEIGHHVIRDAKQWKNAVGKAGKVAAGLKAQGYRGRHLRSIGLRANELASGKEFLAGAYAVWIEGGDAKWAELKRAARGINLEGLFGKRRG